ACIFEAIPESRLARSVPHSRPRGCFLSLREARSPHETRCQVRFLNSLSVFEYPLPSGIFQSLGLKARYPIPSREACSSKLPDLPLLPAALKIISYHRTTDHRSRSATSRQACCPSNLL